MTQEEYLKQNSLGFEGDEILKETISKICIENDIEVIVELGSYRGATAKQFSKMCDTVITVDIDANNYNETAKTLVNTNVICHHGDSVEKLKNTILPSLNKYKNILFFIDSHWYSNNPLLQELDLIKQFGLKPFIIIHDFKVPGNEELGFDSYETITYEWDWIKKSIESIYCESGYKKYYNSEATGAKRGVVFIEPKKRKNGLVSCLMLSKNEQYVRRSIDCFFAQTYNKKELIVIADSDGVYDIVSSLIKETGTSEIILERSTGGTIGEKRNQSLDLSSGEYLCLWDDDDIFSQERIQIQLSEMIDKKYNLSILNGSLMLNMNTGEKFKSITFDVGFGCTYMWKYTDDRFDSVNQGEDTYFYHKLLKRYRYLLVKSPEVYTYCYHGANTVSFDHWSMFLDKKIN